MPVLTAADTEELVRGIAKDIHIKRLFERGRRRISRWPTARMRASASACSCKRVHRHGGPVDPEDASSTWRKSACRPVMHGTHPAPTRADPRDGADRLGQIDLAGQHAQRHQRATSRLHIVTIEDPIEYFHEHKRGLVNQREVGVDVPTFGEALKRVLRQDPDVILVGEMRDLETMEAAITAAETGHLVFSTLHTTGAARTVDRIIDSFPAGQQEQIRIQLAGNLKAVLSQVLIPAQGRRRGRVAAFELMINNAVHRHAHSREQDLPHRQRHPYRRASSGWSRSKPAWRNLYHHRGLISRNEVLARAQDLGVANQLLDAEELRLTARIALLCPALFASSTRPQPLDSLPHDHRPADPRSFHRPGGRAAFPGGRRPLGNQQLRQELPQVMTDFEIANEDQFYQAIADSIGADYVNLAG